jgi:pyruvate dehydrogenase (quinone)
MLFGELLTLHQLALPVKVVVFNNGSLAFVDLEMKAAGIVNCATDLDNPNFAEVARAIGLHGVRVERPDELDEALRDAFAHNGPAVIDIVTAREELSMPPKLTFEQIKGFTLYATRTILSGRADEIVELAKTNIRDLGVE